MTKVVTPSIMTNEQIGKAGDLIAAGLRKEDFPSGAAQEVLERKGAEFVATCVAAFRALVEEITQRIVHIVMVNRRRSPQDALKATGRKLYVTDSVAAAMPRGTDVRVKLVYFKPGPEAYKNGLLSCAALAEEYKKNSLKPDPQAQIEDNAANPEFADEHPNACQWKDEDGNFCYVAFNRWNDERFVSVNRNDNDWNDNWVFAGVPKLSSFLAPHFCGVEFYKLPLPPTEHLADLIHFLGERNIFFRFE